MESDTWKKRQRKKKQNPLLSWCLAKKGRKCWFKLLLFFYFCYFTDF